MNTNLIGKEIKIIAMPGDPQEADYIGRTGIVKSVDSAGQLHGTWGGLAIIPEHDTFEVLGEETARYANDIMEAADDPLNLDFEEGSKSISEKYGDTRQASDITAKKQTKFEKANALKESAVLKEDADDNDPVVKQIKDDFTTALNPDTFIKTYNLCIKKLPEDKRNEILKEFNKDIKNIIDKTYKAFWGEAGYLYDKFYDMAKKDVKESFSLKEDADEDATIKQIKSDFTTALNPDTFVKTYNLCIKKLPEDKRAAVLKEFNKDIKNILEKAHAAFWKEASFFYDKYVDLAEKQLKEDFDIDENDPVVKKLKGYLDDYINFNLILKTYDQCVKTLPEADQKEVLKDFEKDVKDILLAARKTFWDKAAYFYDKYYDIAKDKLKK